MHLVKTTQDTGTEDLEEPRLAPPPIDNAAHSPGINSLLDAARAEGKLDGSGYDALKDRLKLNELSFAFAKGYIGALHAGANVGAGTIGALK